MSNQGKAGSFIDFQIAVEQRTAINSDIQSLRPDWKGANIKWYSPIEESGYKEFHDVTFWDGRFKKSDPSFWEGLGYPSDGSDFLKRRFYYSRLSLTKVNSSVIVQPEIPMRLN